MASGPITSWEIDGETVADFIFLGSKITADGDCSHKIKRRLLLGRKVMTNLDSILKSRDITLSTKVRLVEAMVFSVIRYGCETIVWTIKKAECQRIDGFELWCWRRLLSPVLGEAESEAAEDPGGRRGGLSDAGKAQPTPPPPHTAPTPRAGPAGAQGLLTAAHT